MSGLLSKILQRGLSPLPMLGVEKASLEENSLGQWISELPEEDPEMGFELSSTYQGKASKNKILQYLTTRDPFRLHKEFEFEIAAEVTLAHSTWAQVTLQPQLHDMRCVRLPCTWRLAF